LGRSRSEISLQCCPDAGTPDVEQNYTWIGAKPPALADYTKAQPQRFKTLAELAAGTGQETHGIEIDYEISKAFNRRTCRERGCTKGQE
jgi:hypothetical protein